MIDNSSVCRDCPRECNSSRTDNDPGMCGAREGFTHFRVAKIMSHKWEEPFISGTNGSAAVFLPAVSLAVYFVKIIRLVVQIQYSVKKYRLMIYYRNFYL